MKKIYVGNVPFKTTEKELQEKFEGYGKVNSVTIIKDRETGNSRGFAFIEMDKDEEANKAIAELNGKDFDGKTLTVNEAKPREEGGGRGFGGGQRRGGGFGGGEKRGGFGGDRGGRRF